MPQTVLNYQGENRTNIDLREITDFLHAFNCSLADGKTEMTLTYDKSEAGTVLTVTTIPPPAPVEKKAKK